MSRPIRCGVIVALLVISVVVAAWPVLSAGELVFPGNAGDSNLILALLEHSWLWVQHPLSIDIWTLPMYHPVTNTAAYSDLMLGQAPAYWLARAAQLSVPVAAVFWFLFQLVLNWISAFVLFRWASGYSGIAAAVGASFLIAANPMQNQFFHPQMIGWYYVVFCAALIIRTIRLHREMTSRHMVLLLALASLSFSLQMYSAFYYAWFLVLIIFLLTAVAMFLATSRAQVVSMVGHQWKSLLVAFGIALVTLFPWARHYLEASRLSEQQTYEHMMDWVPRWTSWLYPGRENIWYERWEQWGKFDYLPQGSIHEQAMSIGFLSLMLIGAGFILARQSAWMISIAGTVVLIFLLTVHVGDFESPWAKVVEFVPGASVVRTLTRISIPVTILLSFGAVWLVSAIQRSQSVTRRLALIAIVAIPLILEGRSNYWVYSVEESLEPARAQARLMPSHCQSFLYISTDDRPAYEKQMIALWIALISGVPTVNGYGHVLPEGWDFTENVVDGTTSTEERNRKVDEWQERHTEIGEPCILMEDS